MQIRTPEELQNLKAKWCGDPTWDLEDTEGFEAHREELKAFAEKQEAIWDREWQTRMSKKAEDLGCPGNLTLAHYIDRLENRVAKLEEAVSR